jgi:hypothetical protein
VKRTVALWLLAALVLAVLGGCARGQPAAASITIANGSRELELKPGDQAYAQVAAQLDHLIAGLATPLYAYSPPARVADEVLVGPYLEAVYHPVVTLQGKGYAPKASQLIVAPSGEGPLVLTRATEGADWTASETSDADRFSSLFRVVREQLGIDLEVLAK